ncbi:MAG: sensor histidine kinase [Oligoflexus sp.]
MPRQTYQREDLSSYLLAHIEQIMEEWELEVRNVIQPLKQQDKLALRNALPKLVEGIAMALKQGHDTIVDRKGQTRHGILRSAITECSLAEVLQEYNILRTIILDVLDSAFDIKREDQKIILEIMAQALSDAVVAFSAERTSQEKHGRLDEDTARNDAERELKRLHEEIERSIESRKILQHERDTSLSEIESLKTERELKDRFIASLSHDLRTPLGVVKMATSLLETKLPEPKMKKDLFSMVNKNLDRVEVMVCDLLDLYRFRSGYHLTLNIRTCNLVQLTNSLLNALTTIHGDRFIFRADKSVIGYWDEDYLARIIDNLLNNAIKYGDTSVPVILEIRQNQRDTIIRVHNRGEPISAAVQKTLFDPFIQARNYRKSAWPGWGLGLTLVKSVAKSHGGEVSLKSNAKDGTIFTVTIPNDSRPFQQETNLI